MNLGALINRFRHRVVDEAVPPMWAALDVTDFANQAEREAAERALLIEDDADAASVTVTLTQSGGIATATAVAHPFRSMQKLRISGATPAGYNVEVATTTKTGADSFTFPVSSSLSSPATGTIIAELVSGLVCNIDGLANIAVYDLHPKIIEVRSVTWDGNFLDGIAQATANERYPRGWRTLTGNPTHYIDPQEKYLTLLRKPTKAAAIHLSVYRYPLADMARDADVPELAERYHFGLIDYMEYLAFSADDTEIRDLPRAAKAEALFTARFGPRIDANIQRKQRARTANQVRMNRNW